MSTPGPPLTRGHYGGLTQAPDRRWQHAQPLSVYRIVVGQQQVDVRQVALGGPPTVLWADQ